MKNDLLAVIAVLIAVLALFGPFLHAVELGNHARDRLVGIAGGDPLSEKQSALVRRDWASFAYGGGWAAVGFGLLFIAVATAAWFGRFHGVALGWVGMLALFITGLLFLGAGAGHLWISHFYDRVAISESAS